MEHTSAEGTKSPSSFPCQEHELEAMLQEAVNSSPASDDASAGGGTYALPPLDSVSITVDAKRAARARDKQVRRVGTV